MTNRDDRRRSRLGDDDPTDRADPAQPMGTDASDTTGYGTAASGADVTGGRGTQARGEGSDVEGEETDDLGSSGAPGNPA